MKKLLVVSYSGFSDTNANGKTLKALLNDFAPENIMQFYRGTQEPDFSSCSRCFRVTDKQIIKSFLRRKNTKYFENTLDDDENKGTATVNNTVKPKQKKVQSFLKKHNYNYALRGLREYLFMLSPWGEKELMDKIEEFSPDGLLYMVGDNFSLDKLVLKIVEKYNIPLILFNTEAFRIIDLHTRHGLEKLYCKHTEDTYEELDRQSALTIYICDMLKEHYIQLYKGCRKHIVAYNSDVFDTPQYTNSGKAEKIAYFGNLGVGRTDPLIEMAGALEKIDENLYIDVYGSTSEENENKLRNVPNIHFHGFVSQNVLGKIKEEADILLHTESFDSEIVPKLKYAFSTKIAQYLCSGRCVVSYAPEETASSQYLINTKSAVVVTRAERLEESLREVVFDGEKRMQYARQAYMTAKENHDMTKTAKMISEAINTVCK